MTLQYHGDFLERSVARSLAYAVDCHLHLTRAVQHAAQSVGRSHAQVIVAVSRNDCVLDSRYVVAKILNLFAIFAWQTISCSVWYIHHCGARLYHSLDHTCQILVVSTAGVLGVELHVIDEFSRVLHCCHRSFDNLLAV